MIDRRSFLAGLLGAAAVPLLAKIPVPSPRPAVPLAFHPDAFAFAFAPLELDDVYRALLADAEDLFRQSRAEGGWPVLPQEMSGRACVPLGGLLPDGTLVDAQCSVSLDYHAVMSYGTAAREWLLWPAMRQLAEASQSYGIDRFAPLVLPFGGCDYAGNAGPLRMVVFYDSGMWTGEESYSVRFDVAGGSSPDARRHLQRDHNARTKRRLQLARALPRRRLRLPA